MDEMLTASAQTLLADLCPPAFVRTVEAAHDGKAGRDLWHQLDELGFLDALVPESRGGSGLTLVACAGVLFAFGQHALPLPAAQTILARQWLAQADVEAPRGPIALALADAAQHGTAFVPFGAVSDAMLVEAGDGARLVAFDEAQVERHGDGLDATVTFAPDAGRPVEIPKHVVAELGALVTAATMAGAMQRVLDMAITYVNDRQQFGRPLGKFQAIQQQLSVMAEHVASTRMAAQLGCAAYRTRKQRLAAAIAKACASRAAPLVANGAHGLVGAMGITAEFDLQLYTRRLHAQRLQYGSESFWDEIVGTHAIDQWSSVAQGVTGLFDALDEAAMPA